ncbi:MAG: DUF2064 domain-containing protein [Actinomycetota bacterium]|nr:DUF2064 domain-containing protein [Actinomycetota bacterium]
MPTVLVLPRGPGTAAMAAPLGLQRVSTLSTLLQERALSAAEAVAPGSVQRLPDLGGDGSLDGLAEAIARVWPQPDAPGPLLILWSDMPRWRPAHLEAALSDLADGCELTVGPVFDGGLYLLGLARPLPALFERPSEDWRSPDTMAMTLAAAVREGLEVGLLRAERALRSPADVAAALADPLLDSELRGVLAT